MRVDPFQVVRDFESMLCDYTGAKYAVTVTSCTSAIMIACAYHRTMTGPRTVIIPKHTYVGVAMAITLAGHTIDFEDRNWTGEYEIVPLNVWDAARWFTSPMAFGTQMMSCVSFHPTKTLGLSGYGGAILHNDDKADEWLRRARFDGRAEGVAPKDDTFTMIGAHCYMSPQTAAEGLLRLSTLPAENEPIPNDDYPDLSQMEIFK